MRPVMGTKEKRIWIHKTGHGLKSRIVENYS